MKHLNEQNSDHNSEQPKKIAPNPDRRFQGTINLYGHHAVQNFEQAHVFVIGAGGVGSWVAEGLARTKIGEITLIDLDVLVESNTNRQLPALDSNFGKSKITAMGERLTQINPNLKLHLIDDFLTAENVSELLPQKNPLKTKIHTKTVILDCTDDMNAKIAIALHCRFNKLKLICAGGAGGKTDPLQIKVADLKDTYQDPLLARLRQRLRQDYQINRHLKQKFGIKCVYSSQPPIINPQSCPTGGLHCGGYGSAVAVTAVFGMIMVSETLNLLSKK